MVGGVQSRLAVVGLQSGPTRFDQTGSIECVEIRISPSIALRLGLELLDLRNAVLPADCVLGTTATVLAERLAATDFRERSLVVAETIRILMPTTRRTRAVEVVEYLERVDPAVGVVGLAADLGGSRGSIWRQTSAALGMSPQRYLMLRRFEHAVTLLQAGSPIAQVAAVAGYADQSHLHRDVVRFAGVTPGVLFSGRDATSIQDVDVVTEEH